jgi:hypothetical protein
LTITPTFQTSVTADISVVVDVTIGSPNDIHHVVGQVHCMAMGSSNIPESVAEGQGRLMIMCSGSATHTGSFGGVATNATVTITCEAAGYSRVGGVIGVAGGCTISVTSTIGSTFGYAFAVIPCALEPNQLPPAAVTSFSAQCGLALEPI